MTVRIFLALAILDVGLIGGIVLLYPRIVRRGLLFGVYVGEKAWASAEARRITRSWYRAMVAWLAATVVISAALALALPHPAVALVPSLLPVVGFLALYLRAFGQARALAPPGPPPPAVAILATDRVEVTVLPPVALALAVGCGLFAVAYSWNAYDALPNIVPTHFGVSGRPDEFRPKSFLSVMLPALLTLLVGVGIAGVTWLTARAKRALRHPRLEASLAAQARFRAAVTRMLAASSLLVSAFLTVLSVSTIRVGLGRAAALPPVTWAFVAALLVVSLGGAIYIALRIGQGGARLERAAADAPLTDGLADNRRWVLGVFYVNRDDPSYLVEQRFGLGYTLNFGNWKAVALVGGFVVAVLVLVAFALIGL